MVWKKQWYFGNLWWSSRPLVLFNSTDQETSNIIMMLNKRCSEQSYSRPSTIFKHPKLWKAWHAIQNGKNIPTTYSRTCKTHRNKSHTYIERGTFCITIHAPLFSRMAWNAALTEWNKVEQHLHIFTLKHNGLGNMMPHVLQSQQVFTKMK